MTNVNEIIKAEAPSLKHLPRPRRRFLREQRELASGRENWAWRNSPRRRPSLAR